MSEFAKVISSLPVSNLDPDLPLKNVDENSGTGPGNKATPTVSPRKRMILSGFGFLERAYNLLGSTATLTGPVEGNMLLIALRTALANLEKFIGFN
jgi:hypothetical protein